MRKKSSRFLTTSHVPEEKKSWTPPNVLPITGEFFRSSTPPETRAPRSRRERTPRTQRLSACRQRSPSYAFILGQIGQEVKGAGDEERLTEPPGVGERLPRVVDRLDLLEVAPGALGEVGCRQGPRAARRRRDEPIAKGGKGREHPLDVLVGEDRGDEDVTRARQTREHVADAAQVVRAVPDLERIVAHPFEPTGKADVDVAVDGTTEEGLRGRDRNGEIAAARGDDHLRPVLARELLPLRLAEHDGRHGLYDGKLFGRNRLTRRPEHFSVLKGDVRQHLDRRAQHVGRLMTSAKARLDDADVDFGRSELGERRCRQQLALRRAL